MVRLRTAVKNDLIDLITFRTLLRGLMNVAATLHDRLRTDQEKVLSGYAYVELTGCDLGLKFAHTVTGEVHNLGNGQPFGDLAAGFAHKLPRRRRRASRHGYAF